MRERKSQKIIIDKMEHAELTVENISTPIHDENVIAQMSNDVSTEIIQDHNSQTNSSMPLFVLDRAGDKRILGKFCHKKKDVSTDIIQDHNSQTNSSMPLFVLDRAGDKRILGKFCHKKKDVSTDIIQDHNSQTNSSMPLFVLDRAGDKRILGKCHKKKDELNSLHEQHEKSVETFTETIVEKIEKTKTVRRKKNKSSIELASSIDPHITFNSYLDSSKCWGKANKLVDVNQILKVTAPPPNPTTEIISQRKQKLLKKKQSRKVAGDNWFNMGAPEMTRTIKNELTLIQMRNSLDPKRFYKSNDRRRFPRYFQMGEVVESAADFYHARIPKKQRKANIVEEMMADAEMKQYIKKKHGEIAKNSKGRNRNRKKK